MSNTNTCAECATPLTGPSLAHPRCGADVHVGCIAAHMTSCVSSVQTTPSNRTGAFAILARRDEGPFCKACDEVFTPTGLEATCSTCAPSAKALRKKRKRSWFSWLAA